jgi:hypothetical protein
VALWVKIFAFWLHSFAASYFLFLRQSNAYFLFLRQSNARLVERPRMKSCELWQSRARTLDVLDVSLPGTLYMRIH